jgi:NAD(P)H-nitrite reductase large subunit
MRVVMVGNGAAAVSAIEALRETDTESEVIVLSAEVGGAYTPCFLAKYVAGEIGTDKLALRSDDFYEEHRVELRTGVAVTGIDTEGRAVVMADGSRVDYDRLLLACGAHAVMPDIPGLDGPGVAVFKSLGDADGIRALARKGSEAVVLGSGFVAVEIAEALTEAGMHVTLVARKDRILRRIFDAEVAALVEEHIGAHGVNIVKGRDLVQVERSAETRQVGAVVLSDGERLQCDLLVVAVGMRPNLGILAGAAIDTATGVITDASMRTNVPDVFAAGDVVQAEIGGVRRTNLIHPWAVATGRAAGRAMVGAGEPMASHMPDMNVLTLFGRSFVSVGAVDGVRCPARRSGPQGLVKVFEGADGTVIGAELVGDITRTGLYASLIGRRIPVSAVPGVLDPGFNYGQTIGLA